MDQIIFEAKNFLYTTIVLAKKFVQNVGIINIIVFLLILYVVFLRKWTFKKTSSFLAALFLLFIFYLRLNNSLSVFFGAEDAQFVIAILNIATLVLAVIILIYYAAVKE